ncbi:hypothetical protein DUI87_12313 [Hirundo rustica rustica]|uniref:Uncharacterized protein n=1 Tax=Hirundo rustica rustica TaxID=333673 RepID=A0A3M0KBS3_HIRRU|nr:hypothetical protein DUI87_12313 [Hirundo rustica rustica]
MVAWRCPRWGHGSNPARPGGFPGANSPGPVADLYGTASQDSGVGNYISAASPQPGSGFGHGIASSEPGQADGMDVTDFISLPLAQRYMINVTSFTFKNQSMKLELKVSLDVRARQGEVSEGAHGWVISSDFEHYIIIIITTIIITANANWRWHSKDLGCLKSLSSSHESAVL